ncbi:unnamed protein product [Cuscuta epithymum]|uniref:BED-type domain-containing protein n=1 Tax=Cuscuta epithymum TaxID=186058 RepID=A0AAV0FWV0_9ASTE|nr:unnamed protein product [Cuscuta epithymum]
MGAPANNSGLAISETQSNKRRRNKSIVWEHFTLVAINGDSTRAFCNQCKKSFAYVTGTKLAGTSHLKRHISLGICPANRLNQGKNQMTPYNPASQACVTATFKARKYSRATPPSFDQDSCNYMIAKMVIQHDYPLQIVEDAGFAKFARTLQPKFISSVDAVEKLVMNIYSRCKQNLLNLLGEIPGRPSLTLDMRTSDLGVGYLFITGYFIDHHWKFHRRLLNVITVPHPDLEYSFSHAVSTCLTDWCFESKLFTLTVDESIANEAVRGNLRSLLSIKNLILDGQLIIGSCFARVLSQLAQDALESMTLIVEKVRQSVKYVKTDDVHEKKFFELKKQLQVPSAKELAIDDYAKWNTTYQMLMAASELKEVFYCLDTSDPDYKITISMDEWKQVEVLCKYLKVFHDSAIILAAPVYRMSSTFFREVWMIQRELMRSASSDDHFISTFTKPLSEKFDKYWKDCNLVLAVAAVMDPRFKMKYVVFSFEKIYNEGADSWIKTVDDGLHELFLDYFVQSLPPPVFVEDAFDNGIKPEAYQEGESLLNGDCFSDFDVYVNDFSKSHHDMKSELDEYLEETLLPQVQEFDVLGWWEMNKVKYPILSKMASDILCIPVSTVLPDSIFDTVKRHVDRFQSSLRPSTLQALFCARDWMQYESSELPLKIPIGNLKIEY